MPKDSGKIIALSGIDGAGKSTQLEKAKAYYESMGRETITLWTRGGYTPGINLLKTLSRKFAGKKLPPSGNSPQREQMIGKKWIQKIWLTIAILDLIWIYGVRIRLWQQQGKTVICDRYLWDTLIDFTILFPHIEIQNWMLWKLLVYTAPRPQTQFLLMIPLELSEKRCAQKYEPFPDTPARRHRRYALYQASSTKFGWKTIDSTRPVEDVFSEIRSMLS